MEARQAAEKENADKQKLLSALKGEKEAMGKEAEDMLTVIAEAEAGIKKAEKKMADFIAKRDTDRSSGWVLLFVFFSSVCAVSMSQ